MSKRTYRTLTTAQSEKAPPLDTPVLVESGWDRPLGWLYLTIHRLQDGLGEKKLGALYSNLARPDPGMSIREIQGVLREQVGQWPNEWLRQLRIDRDKEVGNEVTSYGICQPEEKQVNGEIN